LTLGLAATTALFSGARHLEQARAESDFRKRGESYITIAKAAGFEDALHALTDTNRLFSILGSVSREQFHDVTQPLPAVEFGNTATPYGLRTLILTK
jgi:hypothetical protein